MMLRFLRPLCIALALIGAGATLFFWTKVHERDRLLGDLIADATHDVPPGDVDALALSLSRAIYARTDRGIPLDSLPWYERWESTSFFNVTTGASLEYGIYGVIGHSQYGPCGTMTRVLLNALWQLGIPARKLQLLSDRDDRFSGHTLVEYLNGDRWEVISPADSSFVWRNVRGEVATLDEIRSDRAVLGEIYSQNPAWRYNFAHPAHIRWAKLPGIVRAGFRAVLGRDRYEHAQTPRLYDQPRHLFLLLSGLATLLCTALAWRLRPDRGGALRT